MAKWGYVATPAGASLGRTFDLANGSVGTFNQDNRHKLGLIHRRLHNDDGQIIPEVTQVRVSDEIVLMYNLFHTGLVYPIARYEVLPPSNAERPQLKPHRSHAHLGVLSHPRDVQELEPDYLGNKDPVDLCHYILVLKKLEPELEKDLVGKVFLRDDGSDHALVTSDSIQWTEESEGLGRLDALIPTGAQANVARKKLMSTLPYVWGKLDGREKQLLISAQRLEDEQFGGECHNYACVAYSLCALAEYVLQRLLKKAADRKLLAGSVPRVTVTRRAGFQEYQLPLVPEPTLYDRSFDTQLAVLRAVLCEDHGYPLPSTQQQLLDAFHSIKKVRNRVTHSYFIEAHHYRDLRDSVIGLLKMVC